MVQSGTINYLKVKEVESQKLEKKEIIKQLKIDDAILKEKNNWYKINNELSFFKERNDARLFGECLSQEIFEKMGIESAKYEIILLNKKLGLITSNFQDINDNDYFDLYNLYKIIPSLNHGYNKYTLKNLLENISYQDWHNKKEIIQELIDRYIGDWVTHQTDGNPRNIMFSYNKNDNTLNVAPSFDREKCFGINSDFDSRVTNSIWVPAIPYEDPNFREKPYEADTNIDANILGLFLDYPEETIRAFERVFNVDYNEIFKKYNKNLYQFTLSNKTINYLCDIIDKKNKERKKILSL